MCNREVLRLMNTSKEEEMRQPPRGTLDFFAHPVPQSSTRIVTLDSPDLFQGRKPVRVKESQTENLAARLSEFVIGQEAATNTVARRIAKARAGLADPSRPLATVMELGPSGVGKTELAKATARVLYGDEWETHFLLINCGTELSERHTTQKITGSPQGYIGGNEEGLIPHGWLNNRSTVVVWDEFEKADPAIWNMVLGIMEEGTIRARRGDEGFQPLDFRSCFMFFTANVGAFEMIKPRLGFITSQTETNAASDIEATAIAAMQRTFPPELINRFSDTQVFNPLTHVHLEKIFDTLMAEKALLTLKQAAYFVVSPRLRQRILSRVNLQFGARNLRMLLEQEVFDHVADLLLDGQTGNFMIDYDEQQRRPVIYSQGQVFSN